VPPPGATVAAAADKAAASPCIDRTYTGGSSDPSPTAVRARRSCPAGGVTSVLHDLDAARWVVPEVPYYCSVTSVTNLVSILPQSGIK